MRLVEGGEGLVTCCEAAYSLRVDSVWVKIRTLRVFFLIYFKLYVS